MGNPQERSLVWLTAAVEMEGTISFQVYTKPNGEIRITPYLTVTNTDPAILAEAERILHEILEGERHAKPRLCVHQAAKLVCKTIRVDGQSCATVARSLLPYFIGKKRRNAEAVIQYVEGRRKNLLQRNPLTGRIKRTAYRISEVELISSIRNHPKAKSSETIRQAPNVIPG